jgi:hypothetical protein
MAPSMANVGNGYSISSAISKRNNGGVSIMWRNQRISVSIMAAGSINMKMAKYRK